MHSDEKYPGMVLVHGGGGRAFREWVTKWAVMGYAAISMDLRGNGPEGEHIAGGFEELDGRIPYISIEKDVTEEWMFQAVSNVILAHSLLRNFGGVDSSKTAITGISWGGIITCVVAGIDHRYKALVPVYGCGFLEYCHAMGKMLTKMSDADERTWVHRYDPKNYLSDCKAPVFFINGTNDNHFFLRPYAKSYALVGNKLLSIKPGMKHNHSAGWDNVEIELFIRNKLLNGAALPRFHTAERAGRLASARMDIAEKVSEGYLLYTVDSCCNGQERWICEKTEVAGSAIQGMLPEQQVSAWFLAVRDPLGAWISSEIKFE
jgi:dienelactone hydrolase